MVALANLSNSLNQTLASGERVLALLEEEPQVEEVSGNKKVAFENAACEKVTFSYEDEIILNDYSIAPEKGKITGIHGKSGSGKSTLLKLFMRFWDVQEGKVEVSGVNVKQINTENLRDMESYVTQETYLFHDSIENNIRVAKPEASIEEILEAAKKLPFTILSRGCQMDTIQKWENWAILFQEERGRGSVLQGHSCTMPRFSCWMNLPVIWIL